MLKLRSIFLLKHKDKIDKSVSPAPTLSFIFFANASQRSNFLFFKLYKINPKEPRVTIKFFIFCSNENFSLNFQYWNFYLSIRVLSLSRLLLRN